MAHRIATLIGAHGIEPEHVLGITFTNKAAEELADRVRSVLGAAVEPARQVEVHTYHGFASQVLREFGALVGVERDVGGRDADLHPTDVVDRRTVGTAPELQCDLVRPRGSDP